MQGAASGQPVAEKGTAARAGGGVEARAAVREVKAQRKWWSRRQGQDASALPQPTGAMHGRQAEHCCLLCKQKSSSRTACMISPRT